MIPSKIKIESFAKRCHMGTLGGKGLSGGSVSCDLWHRRKMASLCVFLQINSLVDHPLRCLFPAQYVLRRLTRRALAAHSPTFEMPRC